MGIFHCRYCFQGGSCCPKDPKAKDDSAVSWQKALEMRESGKQKQYSPEQPEKEDQSILGAHKKIQSIFGSNMNQQNHAKQTRNKDGYLKAIQISGGAKLRSIAIRRGPPQKLGKLGKKMLPHPANHSRVCESPFKNIQWVNQVNPLFLWPFSQ